MKKNTNLEIDTYGIVSELARDVGAVRELSVLVDWVTTNLTHTEADLRKYIDNRLITLTNK